MSPSLWSIDPERTIRQALAGLEAELREYALLALADWEAVGVAGSELFRAVAGLQRPSWGHWNGLLTALRETRRTVLRTGSAAERERVRQASTLEAVLDFLDREAGPSFAALAEPLARFVHVSLPRKPRFGNLLTLPIALRNLVVHFAPTDSAWWKKAVAVFQPFAES